MIKTQVPELGVNNVPSYLAADEREPAETKARFPFPPLAAKGLPAALLKRPGGSPGRVN